MRSFPEPFDSRRRLGIGRLNAVAVLVREDGQQSDVIFEIQDDAAGFGAPTGWSPNPGEMNPPAMTRRRTDLATGANTLQDLRFSVVRPQVLTTLQVEPVEGERMDLVVGWVGMDPGDYQRIFSGRIARVQAAADGMSWDLTVIEAVKSLDGPVFRIPYGSGEDFARVAGDVVELALWVLMTTDAGSSEPYDLGEPGFGMGLTRDQVDVDAFEAMKVELTQLGIIGTRPAPDFAPFTYPRWRTHSREVPSGLAWVRQLLACNGCYQIITGDGRISIGRLRNQPAPTSDVEIGPGQVLASQGTAPVRFENVNRRTQIDVTHDTYVTTDGDIGPPIEPPVYQLSGQGTQSLRNHHAVNRDGTFAVGEIRYTGTHIDVIANDTLGGGEWRHVAFETARRQLDRFSWTQPKWRFRMPFSMLGVELGDDLRLHGFWFPGRGLDDGGVDVAQEQGANNLHAPPGVAPEQEGAVQAEVTAIAPNLAQLGVDVEATGYARPVGAEFVGRNEAWSPAPVVQDFVEFRSSDPGRQFPGTTFPLGERLTFPLPGQVWRGSWLLRVNYTIDIDPGSGVDKRVPIRVWARCFHEGDAPDPDDPQAEPLIGSVAGRLHEFRGLDFEFSYSGSLYLWTDGTHSERAVANERTPVLVNVTHRVDPLIDPDVTGTVSFTSIEFLRPTWGDYDPGLTPVEGEGPEDPPPVFVEEETAGFGGG